MNGERSRRTYDVGEMKKSREHAPVLIRSAEGSRWLSAK